MMHSKNEILDKALEIACCKTGKCNLCSFQKHCDESLASCLHHHIFLAKKILNK